MNKKMIILTSAGIVIFLIANVFLINQFYSKNNKNPETKTTISSTDNQLNLANLSLVSEDIKPKVDSNLKKETVVETKKFTPKKVISMPVLMYHHINNLDWIPASDLVGIGLRVSPEIFEQHLKQIQQRKYTTITSVNLQKYIDGIEELPENPLMITVDDGYKDNYTKALPLLKKYNMKADFAIITGLVGSNDYMTWDEVKDLKKQGMDISSHTVHHCYLAVKQKDTPTGFAASVVSNEENKECPEFNSGSKLNTAQIKGELKKSKQELETQLGEKVYSIVYPFGNYNEQVEAIAKELGYSFGFTVKPQNLNKEVNFDSPYSIPRTRVNGQQSGKLIGFFEVK